MKKYYFAGTVANFAHIATIINKDLIIELPHLSERTFANKILNFRLSLRIDLDLNKSLRLVYFISKNNVQKSNVDFIHYSNWINFIERINSHLL